MNFFKFRKSFKTAILVIILTLCTAVFVFADNMLTNISVDYNAVKKIIIDGVVKEVPDDMRPFVYNGRTYVPLRYVAEAMGKDVKWDDSSETITIDLPNLKEYTDTLKFGIGNNWQPEDRYHFSKTGVWLPGENGIKSAPPFSAYGNIAILNKKYYRFSTSYTIEVDIMASEFSEDYKNPYGELGIFIGVDIWSPKPYTSNHITLHYGDSPNDEKDDIKIDKDKFYKLKVVRQNNKVDIYLDDKYIKSQDLDTLSEGSEYIGLYTPNAGNYFKDFKFICN